MNFERYSKQILLKEFGIAAQEKLLNAKVLVVGAGGLGCPALQYLAAAGVGTIGIVDFDVVEISNLHRQILYNVDDIGKSKAETAALKLNLLNPEIKFQSLNLKLQTSNTLKIVSQYDLVIDGSDNFSTRYLVNDACVLLNKPLVYGAVLQFEGQVGVFNLADKKTNIKTNYRNLFPAPPENYLSCNEAGVLGVLPGIIGTMQAAEAIKIITKIDNPLSNKIISYNALNNFFYEFEISPDKKTEEGTPKNEMEFLNFNYDWFCELHNAICEISVKEFNEMMSIENLFVIDVREKTELPLVDEFPLVRISLSEFEKLAPIISPENKVVVFCKSGKRSIKVAKTLKEKFPTCSVFSLAGGITAWEKQYKKISV